jgi:hypothetical protein
MCNLYTYKLSRDEIRGLMDHYKLIGTEWAELFEREMQGKNDEALVYPNYLAPAVIDRDGARTIERMRCDGACPGQSSRRRLAKRPSRPAE